jgi:hypothetical protein
MQAAGQPPAHLGTSKPRSASSSAGVITSTPRSRAIDKAPVTGNKGAVLVLGGDSDQSVAAVIDVSRSESVDSLRIISETSKVQARSSSEVAASSSMVMWGAGQ